MTRICHYRYVVDIAAMVPDHLEQVWNELHGSLRTAIEQIVLDNTDHYDLDADVLVDDGKGPPQWYFVGKEGTT